MATTFNFEINNRPTKNRTYVILLRITQDKKHKRIKTSIELKSRGDFNPKARQGNWIRSSEPRYKSWNNILENELEKVKNAYRELKEEGLASKENIKRSIVEGERGQSFLEYARKRTQEIYNQGSLRNYKKYNGFCNKLEGFVLNDLKQKDLIFAELNPALLARFDAYMNILKNEREPNKKLHPNTIVVNLNIFKTLIKRAIEIDSLMKPDKNPFMTFSYRGIRTSKEKLDSGEIERIRNLNLPQDSLIWHSRNCFLFSYYSAGIRVGDLLQLRWINIPCGERIVYEMDKNHKYKDLILVPQAKQILSYYSTPERKANDYIFPFLNSSADYAKYCMSSN